MPAELDGLEPYRIRLDKDIVIAFLDTHERAQLQAISDVTYCNPLLPAYPEGQRTVLGDDFLESQALWHMRGDDSDAPLVEPVTIAARLESLLSTLRERLIRGAMPKPPAASTWTGAP